MIDRRSLMAAAGLSGLAGRAFAEADAGALHATGLRTEYLVDPMGLEVERPRLSWRSEGAGRGRRQSAYRVVASASRGGLAAGRAELWDSGRVASDACFEIAWGGGALASRQQVFWRVQLWDESGRASAPSAPALFEMGLLEPSDWRGDWLEAQSPEHAADRAAGLHWIWGANPLEPGSQRFRWRLRQDRAPAKAELLLSAKDHLLGVWLNGEPLPLPEQVFWGTMTVFPLTLIAGENVICVEAKADATGFFPVDGGAVVALAKVTDAAGRVQRRTTGPDWKTSNQDAPGWTTPGFDDRAWAAAEPTRAHVFNEPYPPEPAPLIRTGFQVKGPVKRARMYETALGAHDARLNGHRVSTSRLAPEISVARDHVFYQVYDVATLLRPGENAWGVVVGDGWYGSAFGWRNERYGFGPGPRRYRAMLAIDYADGTSETIATGPDWRMGPSPILSSEIYDGEVFDARLRTAGWDVPGFDGSAWAPMKVGEPPAARLVAQLSPPIRQTMVLAPKAVSEPKPGVFVFDFGQNFAGWCRFKGRAPAGTTVELRFAEILKPSGEVDQSNLRGAKARERFTFRGDAEGEAYEPHFTYHGFRYVELNGYPATPSLDTLEGVVAHSDCTPSGKLRLEDPLAQKIWTNALWSQRSNFFGVPTDCPQRDERMGWMGDIQVFLDAASFNMDTDGFIRRFTREIRAAQTPDGGFPIVAPQPLSFPDVVTAGWSEAGVILPWTLWRRYGDVRVVEENWDAMARWVAYVAEANPDFVWRNRRGLDLGDWLSVDAVKPDDETTPRALCATAYWAYTAKLMAEMAEATGRRDDAARYRAMRQAIGRAYASAFVTPDGTCGNGSQTSYVLSLKFGLAPEDLRATAGAKLAADIRRRGMRLSTGFLGTPYLLDVLTDTGQGEVAAALLLQTAYPSWGYMISKGATTMWERWNGDVGDVAMNSYNHYAFGAVVGFMYRRLGGIAPAAPGFREIEVAPVYHPRIGRVRADYDSVLGRISTDVDGDATGVRRLALSVPPNATARVELPPRAWRESRRPVQGRPDLRLSPKASGLRVEVGSGEYLFEA